MSSVSRTALLKNISENVSIALKKPQKDFTLSLNTDTGIMVDGKFGPAATV